MSNADEKQPGPVRRDRSHKLAWLGLAVVPAAVAIVALLTDAKPLSPHFRKATICFSRDGHEFAWCGLHDQQSQPTLSPKSCGINDKKTGTSVQIEWNLLRSSPEADTYEFRIKNGSTVPIVKRVEVSRHPIELLKSDDIVVTIREMTFDASVTEQ